MQLNYTDHKILIFSESRRFSFCYPTFKSSTLRSGHLLEEISTQLLLLTAVIQTILLWLWGPSGLSEYVNKR